MDKVELLSPVGNFEALIAAVQCGADAVYFGADVFNARANSKNFNREELKKTIKYAKLRNVKTHLTLNILIKNNEFEDAMDLAKYAYECGIDAIIVQDLGLARKIIKQFPNLDVHSSTQMTIYNSEGAKKIKELGFKRCVLARELSINEIKEICENTDIEIETFIHGALCMCYSGQCLMSSMIGGRSGNRGKCAGTCRLPYNLLKDGQSVDKGYLLSSKDVCGLDLIPEMIKAGIKSFKIEGRMKSPEYVGIVTSIYRKYIDLAYSDDEYVVDENDREKLLQIFNRGGFSTGYLNGKLGREMMYKYKPNHVGIYVGEVSNYNANKGYVKFKAEKEVVLGDSIAINDSSCKISELMINNTNIKVAKNGQIITSGRIKGNIKVGDKIYKTVSVLLNKGIEEEFNKENKRRKIDCEVEILQDMPIKLKFMDKLTGICVEKIGVIPEIANNEGLSENRIIEQIRKLGNTVFEVENIDVKLDQKIITSISNINELRRNAIQELEEKIVDTFGRKANYNTLKEMHIEKCHNDDIKVSLCLNYINEKYDYERIENVDNVYIPLRYFVNSKLSCQVEKITQKFDMYILMPAIYKENYYKINIDEILKKYRIKGIVTSNLSQINIFKNVEKIANYTYNISNNYTIDELKMMEISKYVASPEFEKDAISNLNNEISKEVIVYGRTLLMTTEYCMIGPYHNCKGLCQDGKYMLKDRMGFEFPILTDRINCNNLIYNSKITSIEWKDLNVNSIRIDILEENIDEINNIINVHKNGKRLEGQKYTNGNLNREI